MKIRQSKIPVIILLLFFFALKGFGQDPYVRMFLKNSLFGDAMINVAYQDEDGFMWIGTDDGLYQYDGNAIIASYDFSKTGVNALLSDSRDILWIGLKDGSIFTKSKNSLPAPFETDSFPAKKITNIVESHDGRIWFGTYGDGLYYLDSGILMRIDDEQKLTDNYIYDIEKDKEGNLWLGTDNGINIIHLNDSKIEVEQLTVSDGLPDFIVQCIDRDVNGNMWIGMHEDGICKYDIHKQQFIVPEQFKNWQLGPVSDILTADERLYIATDGKGVITGHLSNSTRKKLSAGDNANLSRIKSMILDKEGNIWLVSNHEISLSLGNKIEILSILKGKPIKNVHAIVSAPDGCIWFGNDQGLFCFNANANNPELILRSYPIGMDLHHQKIMSLFADHAGFIWIGTFGQGIIRLNPGNGDYKRFDESNGLRNANILAIEGDPHEIWLATLGGAARFKTEVNFDQILFKPKFENFGKDDGLSNNFIYDITIDQKGVVWFATDGSGVIYYKNGQFFPITEDSGFNNKVVYSVVSDMDANIWLNVAHEGLYRYDGNQIIKQFNDPDHQGLTINGILPNNNHELVIAYDHGLEIINSVYGATTQYEHNAGLELMKADLNTLALDQEGSVWIGGMPFIVKYNPAKEQNHFFPKSHIYKVELYLEQIDSNATTFNFNENHFTFHYTGLWYQYPEKVSYKVKLEGHDLDWIQTKDNSIIYSNLSPGTYTFRVISGLNSNFTLGDEATYSFTITQPFYNTFWFMGLVLLLIIFFVIFYIKLRERNIRRKQEIIRDRIMFQFENLKSQINPHFLFNSFSTLIALIETEPEKAIEYVTELSALFRNVLEYKDVDVITVNEELKIAENYIQLQKKRYNNNLIIDQNIPDNLLFSKIPPLTLQLLIENALKHNIVSQKKPLTISIYADLSKDYMFVKNNLQLKKEVLSSTGIGIETIVNRYRILSQKEILIDKNDVSFSVGIPIIYP